MTGRIGQADAAVGERHANTPISQFNTAPILFVTLSLDVGGAERHLSAVLPMLQAHGWPTSIYCMNRLGAFAEQVKASGVEVIGPPFERRPGAQSFGRRIYATAQASRRLIGIVRRIRPTIIHFFLPEAYVFGAPTALMMGVPIRIMSWRGMNIYQRHWPGISAIERRLHPHMTGILANSRRVLHELQAEGCRPDQTAIIYNGVALAGPPPDVDREAIRRSLGIAPGGVAAIVVANLIFYKGHADILTSLGQTQERLPADWRLICVGRDEGERERLEQMSRTLGIADHVQFTGVRQDIATLLNASDMSMLASHEEGFSNAVIEAMAAGLPQIVTDVGGNGEAVIDDEHGIVVPPRDPVRLGDAIVRLMNDSGLRRRMGAAARERATARFSMEACVDHYQAAYRGLLAGRRLGDIELD